MRSWGPADWYVVGGAVFGIAAIAWGCLAWFGENFHLGDFRGPLIRSDPANKVPYHRPHDDRRSAHS